MSTPVAGTRTGFDTYTLAGQNEARQEAIHVAPATVRWQGLTGWIAARMASFRRWRYDSRCRSELGMMSDRELKDIGLTRCDLHRIFKDDLNQDLRARL